MTATQLKESGLLTSKTDAALRYDLTNAEREIKRYTKGSLGYNHFADVIDLIQEEQARRG
jgi:hypothetical protein